MRNGKKIREKVLFAIFSLALMICIMPVAVHAESTETADFVDDPAGAIELLGGDSYVEYDVDNNEITLKGVDFSTSAPVAVTPIIFNGWRSYFNYSLFLLMRYCFLPAQVLRWISEKYG